MKKTWILSTLLIVASTLVSLKAGAAVALGRLQGEVYVFYYNGNFSIRRCEDFTLLRIQDPICPGDDVFTFSSRDDVIQAAHNKFQNLEKQKLSPSHREKVEPYLEKAANRMGIRNSYSLNSELPTEILKQIEAHKELIHTLKGEVTRMENYKKLFGKNGDPKKLSVTLEELRAGEEILETLRTKADAFVPTTLENELENFLSSEVSSPLITTVLAEKEEDSLWSAVFLQLVHQSMLFGKWEWNSGGPPYTLTISKHSDRIGLKIGTWGGVGREDTRHFFKDGRIFLEWGDSNFTVLIPDVNHMDEMVGFFPVTKKEEGGMDYSGATRVAVKRVL
jgi:hypothetical protein